MRDLSRDIEEAIKTTIEGLEYRFDLNEIEDDKMKQTMRSKMDSFKAAKQLLYKWKNSDNAPHHKTIEKYIKKIISAGDFAIHDLRAALKKKISYDDLNSDRHHHAINAKTDILTAITEINASLIELETQLKTGKINLGDEEIKRGWPEKFAYGEFYPLTDYYEDWYDEDYDAIILDPNGTKGELKELDGLKMWLPKVPEDKTQILYHDLPKEQQFWRREPVPEGCTPENGDAFIEYIYGQYKKFREGVWFYNNGEPVWLPGSAWFALTHCEMLDDGEHMKFRYAQLDVMYHQEACDIDKRSLGQIFLKSRRTGFTYIVLFRLLYKAISTKNGTFGLTSKGETDAEAAFGKLVYAYQNLPWFFQPVTKSKDDTKSKLEFAKKLENSRAAKKEKKISTKGFLNTSIDFGPARESTYDSRKMNGYLGDECGKWENGDYTVHFGQFAPTMMPGGRVVGKAFIGSTVGPMDKDDRTGKAFKTLYDASRVSDRNPDTGRTSTGLYAYFLPAHENQDAFIDKYGKCWKKKPPKGVKNHVGEPILRGSEDYVKGLHKSAEMVGDAALNQAYKNDPMTESQAFRDDADQSVFNLVKIYDQMHYNEQQKEHDLYIKGDFEWEDGIPDSKVIWYPNKNGRFNIAWFPPNDLQNKVIKKNGYLYPGNDFGALAADPFSVGTTIESRGSKGAIHGKTNKIAGLDGIPNNKFFLEYLNKTKDVDIYTEDVIKAIHFFGLPILPENNRADLVKELKRRGYRGFVMNRVDVGPEKYTDTDQQYGGQPLRNENTDLHQNSISSWIEAYVGKASDNKHREVGEMGDMPFNETLEDWLKFNPAKRTKHDASISSGIVIMATQKEKYAMKKTKPSFEKVKPIFKKYNNTGNISTVVR